MPERRHANARWRIALATIAGLLPIAPLASADDLPPVSARPPAWKLHKVDDDPAVGFSIYRNDLPSSDFDAYRLEALIDVPPAVVAAAALRSVAGPPDDGLDMERSLIRRDENEIVTYSLIRIPIVADRDIVTRVRRSHDEASGAYRIAWEAIDSEGPPPKRGVERIQKSDGGWTFAPAGPGRTLAIYESHTEVSGPMPAWLVNRMMTNTIETQIERLREKVAAEVAVHGNGSGAAESP